MSDGACLFVYLVTIVATFIAGVIWGFRWHELYERRRCAKMIEEDEWGK